MSAQLNTFLTLFSTILPEHLFIYDSIFLMLLTKAAKGESFIVFLCTLTVKILESWIRPTVSPASSLNAKLSYATWCLVLHSCRSLTLLAKKLSSLWTKCKSVKLYLEHSLGELLMWHQNYRLINRRKLFKRKYLESMKLMCQLPVSLLALNIGAQPYLTTVTGHPRQVKKGSRKINENVEDAQTVAKFFDMSHVASDKKSNHLVKRATRSHL